MKYIRPVEKPVEKTAEKTVYISMGTVVKNPEIYRNCIEALKDTEYQVILSLGQNSEKFTDLPENIQVYDFVDQMAVLSIEDVFLTHCGMNSVSEALYYEVPLVLFPQTPEQCAVADRTKELGAGEILSSGTASEIMKAIDQVLNHPEYKEAAGRISKSFKESGGAGKAKEYLETLC